MLLLRTHVCSAFDFLADYLPVFASTSFKKPHNRTEASPKAWKIHLPLRVSRTRLEPGHQYSVFYLINLSQNVAKIGDDKRKSLVLVTWLVV